MGYGSVNTGYISRVGGFIEMEEELPVGSRKQNMLYGLVLADFEPKTIKEEVNTDVDD